MEIIFAILFSLLIPILFILFCIYILKLIIQKVSRSFNKNNLSHEGYSPPQEEQYSPQFHKQKHFFTRSEKMLYEELKRQLSDRYEIFAKTRIADFIQADDYRSGFNRIVRKHVDFLLCSKDVYEPLVAIELNGKSHNSRKMRKRDSFVSKVYEQANVKFVTIHVGQNFKEVISNL